MKAETDPDAFRVDVAEGKYSVLYDGKGKMTALRYCEPWGRDLCGDNLVFAMAFRIRELQKALELGTALLVPLESGDSRCVSDEFVALAAVSAGCGGDRAVAVIEAALERIKISPPTACACGQVTVEAIEL